MKLLLMRHATTENAGKKTDIERELTSNGRDEAAQAALFLRNYQINRVLVSYAKRTMQTFEIIKEQNNLHKFEITSELYQKLPEVAIDLISRQDNINKQLLVIGHNPTIYHVALILANKTEDNYENLIDSGMPPARIIVIDFPHLKTWQELQEDVGKITNIFTPVKFR